MDYKTNVLNKEVKVADEILGEVAGLFFGTLSNDQVVFDYTAYFEQNELEPIDYKVFMRTNKRYIELLAKVKGRNTSDLFFQNKNGHILVAAELVFVFLAFSNPEMLIYFNALVSDVVASGVAYSDSFIYAAASERLPTEVLAEIIKKRLKENEEGDKQQSDTDSGV